MATLILTSVGTALGGPIGGALGAALGGAIDGRLLAPKARRGPRLSELKLQGSSFGTAIPRIYGRMRVAGTVIWSTDLQESRTSEGGGKARPKTASYSYSASFAVALSSRPIVEVGRIWADGKLLRGAAGDLKVKGGFRVMTGDPDQPVDPLIASAVGPDRCPAHRGIAYALFTDLALGDYGNRIPTLSFEVIADASAPAVAAILTDLAGGGMGGGASGARVQGYAADGETGADAAAPLVEAFDLGLHGPADAPVVSVAGRHVPMPETAVRHAPEKRRQTRAAADTLPVAVTLAHYDPARDYQAGMQAATLHPGDGRIMEHELPATLDAEAARALAAAIGRRTIARRISASLPLTLSALALRPGDTIASEGLAGHWRVEAMDIQLRGVTLELARCPADADLAPGTADPGEPVREPDRPVPASAVRVLDLPGQGSGEGPLWIAAAGMAPGWRGCGIVARAVTGEETVIGRAVLESVMGQAATVLGPAGTSVFDHRSMVEVDLLHDEMTLNPARDAALLSGANLALIGNELIQFGDALQIGAVRWRLSRLLRGRGGSEAAASAHAAGERFVLIDRAALIPMPAMTDAGAIVAVRGDGVNDPPAGWRAVPDNVAGDKPWAPVHLRRARQDDGSVTLSWIRRTRAGGGWTDGIDVPLSEDREAYRVVVHGGGASRAYVIDAPYLTLDPGTIAALGGMAAEIAVFQIGTHGLSPPAAARLSDVAEM